MFSFGKITCFLFVYLCFVFFCRAIRESIEGTLQCWGWNKTEPELSPLSFCCHPSIRNSKAPSPSPLQPMTVSLFSFPLSSKVTQPQHLTPTHPAWNTVTRTSEKCSKSHQGSLDLVATWPWASYLTLKALFPQLQIVDRGPWNNDLYPSLNLSSFVL